MDDFTKSGRPSKSGRFGVTVLIPARGGSKGIEKKNLRLVGGVSLVGRAVEIAKQLAGIDAIVVSTDDSEIASEAVSRGALVHQRSELLSRDDAVVADLIRSFFGLGQPASAPSPEIANSRYFLLLEPTAPLRRVASLSACLSHLADGADSSATMGSARIHPLRVFRRGDGLSIVPFIPLSDPWNPRQTLEPVYQMTGGAYGCDLVNFPLDGKSLVFGDFRPVFVNESEAVDIDSLLDLYVADYLATSSETIQSET